MICIRGFLNKDAEEAAAIWNRVVEDGVAFPQLETLSSEEAKKFFGAQDSPELHTIPKPEKRSVFIFSIRIISEDAVILQTQAMP